MCGGCKKVRYRILQCTHTVGGASLTPPTSVSPRQVCVFFYSSQPPLISVSTAQVYWEGPKFDTAVGKFLGLCSGDQKPPKSTAEDDEGGDGNSGGCSSGD